MKTNFVVYDNNIYVCNSANVNLKLCLPTLNFARQNYSTHNLITIRIILNHQHYWR